MRIISGEAKGRRLHSPSDQRIRPTSDRVKEALFNILASTLPDGFTGLRVLDLFAGTGNLGLEALSRGASFATFVDNHRESADLIRRNIEVMHFTGRSKVIVKETTAAIKSLEDKEAPVQLVFIDPPYRMGLIEKVLELLEASTLVDSATIIIAEFSRQEKIPTVFGSLKEFDRRRYGDTSIAFYRREPNE